MFFVFFFFFRNANYRELNTLEKLLGDGFRKGKGTRDEVANIHWIIKKAREFQKKIYFCFIDCTKAFNCGESQQAMENSSRDGTTRPPYLPPEKPVCRSRSNS